VVVTANSRAGHDAEREVVATPALGLGRAEEHVEVGIVDPSGLPRGGRDAQRLCGGVEGDRDLDDLCWRGTYELKKIRTITILRIIKNQLTVVEDGLVEVPQVHIEPIAQDHRDREQVVVGVTPESSLQHKKKTNEKKRRNVRG
jgi:hypothetical protein